MNNYAGAFSYSLRVYVPSQHWNTMKYRNTIFISRVALKLYCTFTPENQRTKKPHFEIYNSYVE